MLFALNPRSSQANRSALRSLNVRDNACAQRKAALKGQHFIPFSAPKKTGAVMDVGLAWMTRDGPPSRPERRLRCARWGENFPRNTPCPLVRIIFRLNFRKVALSLQPIQPACGFTAGALLSGCGAAFGNGNLVVALNIL
jgi:hypothetical protein